MGRVKLQIKKLDNLMGRQATFTKRRQGIMKKAKELSILCDIDVVLLMFSPAGKPLLCSGKHSIDEVIAKFAQLTPQERAKRKLENLEALKKSFTKVDHDVNISEFLDRSKPTIEALIEKVRFLQAHLSELHTRLSYWTGVEKIENVDDLHQLENSLRQSLYQIRAHKESLLQHQQQQQQLISTECKNQMQLQNEIDLDFGLEMEQQLENFSWIRTDGTMNVPVQDESQNPYKDIPCSASYSLGSYTELENGGIPRTSSVANQNMQLSNLGFLSDPKLQQLAEWNLLGSPADYYVSQILEASYKPQYGGNFAPSETLPHPASVFDDILCFRGNQAEK